LKAIEGELRSEVLIATKAGLQWEDGKVSRNAGRARILREVEDSLRRLRTDYIDIYQVHWPDLLVTIEKTAEAMHTLFKQGKIRAIGVSNFSVLQMERFRRIAPLHVLQPPYSSSAESRPTFCPTAAKTALRRWDMARCVGDFCPDG
jgi:aryl-alcohol dehydrogenase-like predicted oxidoreductase